jgi:predicted AAA+ superfamily ATPase
MALQFPIVAVTGPRQSGKTTLVRQVFGGKPYVSLEDTIELSFAQTDPRGFLQRFARGAIFDEAQRWPDLFSHLQGMVDADRTPGRFILTGSQQFGLMAGITQSLAGRVGLARLLPLALSEIKLAISDDLHTHLWRGAYPALWQSQCTVTDANDWFGSYVLTYIARRAPAPAGTESHYFSTLCALVCGAQRHLAKPGVTGHGCRHQPHHSAAMALRTGIQRTAVFAATLPPQFRQAPGQNTQALLHRYRSCRLAGRHP